MANSKMHNMFGMLRKAQIAVPILLLCVLAMVILPLSPLMLDILFTFNIVLAVIVLLVSVNMQRPLDFAIFPTLLLIGALIVTIRFWGGASEGVMYAILLANALVPHIEALTQPRHYGRKPLWRRS